ncbi:MAG: hypothetical protein ACE149_12705 [Armatimonadota bacterium]
MGASSPRQASLYRLSYTGSAFELSGRIIGVGSRFSLSSDAARSTSAADAELLKQAMGSHGMNLTGGWRLGAGLALTSSYDTTSHDDVTNEQHGLTTSRISHALTLNLGSRTSVKASLSQQKDEWVRWLGRPSKETREQRVELSTAFGPKDAGGFRLAVGSLQSAEGAAGSAASTRQREDTTEAHLNLAPVARLRLNADYVAKSRGDGSEAAQSVGATLKLAPDAELTATTKALNASAGGRRRETGIGLAAKLAGGQLGAEQRTERSGEGMTTSRKLSFASAAGNSPAATNVKVDFHESRGDRPDGQLVRNLLARIDRRLSRWLTIAAERQDAAKGTTAAPERLTATKYEATAALGPKTSVTAGVLCGWQTQPSADSATTSPTTARREERRVAIYHAWPRMRVKVEGGSWQDGAGLRSRQTYAVELPTGALPDWAAAMSSAHQFTDSEQYLLGRRAEWSPGDMSFAGYRLWITRRTGLVDGVGSLGFVHRRTIGSASHLQIGFEQRPEGTDGDQKGRPLPLRRQSVEVGRRLTGGVNVRCGLGLQTGTDVSTNRTVRARIGLWGRLGRGDQVEGDLWRESGRWDQAAVERTSLAVLYSRRVSDEDRVELKVGYTWGTANSSDRNRDCRFALAMDRAI